MRASSDTTLTIDPACESLRTALVCDALDGMGYRERYLTIPLVHLSGPQHLIGRCHTTLWVDQAHEDPDPYALELQAVDSARPGSILVAAAHGSMRSGIWGELLSTAARNSGCLGAVVDGAVRDVRLMRAMNFPVLARGVCPADSKHRQTVVASNVVVEVGGVTIAPGDLLFADEDGVVIVPQSVEAEAIARATAKLHDENAVRDQIRAGMKAAEAWKRYGVL